MNQAVSCVGFLSKEPKQNLVGVVPYPSDRLTVKFVTWDKVTPFDLKLTEVIDNLCLIPDFYAKATLVYSVSSSDPDFVQYYTSNLINPAPGMNLQA